MSWKSHRGKLPEIRYSLFHSNGREGFREKRNLFSEFSVAPKLNYEDGVMKGMKIRIHGIAFLLRHCH